MPKQLPILFNDEMVRAIIAGRKTQTRRPLRPMWYSPFAGMLGDDDVRTFAMDVVHQEFTRRDRLYFVGVTKRDGTECCAAKASFAAGDVLWVRECWAPLSEFDPSGETGVLYRADCSPTTLHPEECEPGFKWRPSIHMPRDAARLFLEVTDVRVERLDSITDADARAEGFKDELEFKLIWYSIYDPVKYSGNPWVFVYSFSRSDKPKGGA